MGLVQLGSPVQISELHLEGNRKPHHYVVCGIVMQLDSYSIPHQYDFYLQIPFVFCSPLPLLSYSFDLWLENNMWTIAQSCWFRRSIYWSDVTVYIHKVQVNWFWRNWNVWAFLTKLLVHCFQYILPFSSCSYFVLCQLYRHFPCFYRSSCFWY